MRKLFDEYGIVLITLVASFIGIEVIIGLFHGNTFIEFVMKGIYGL